MKINISNSEFIAINKNILNNIHLFKHEELLILLFLHSGPKTISSIRSRFDIAQSKLEKCISFLQKNGFVESKNEIISLGSESDFSSLMRREGALAGELELKDRESTDFLSLPVTSSSSFALQISMPAKCRELSYLIFDRLSWDLSRPFDKIFNTREWVKECKQLLDIANNDMRLVRDAIDTLSEKGYTINSPRSLFKTVSMIKSGTSVKIGKNKNEEDFTPEIF